ncbi:hypothetical protein WMY93_016361 [Mugilogobius chulae]|uniref:Osteopetrosis-associated transmembrane protein 1 n=1 Tax=Mugilogobius chulae TaxID=88201 RepID=A0AAW0NXE9_9GOBI
MAFKHTILCIVLSCICISVCVSEDVVSSLDGQESLRSASSPVFKDNVDTVYSVNLLTAISDYSDISQYCKNLLDLFGIQYVDYVNCLVPAARPVKVCQNCFVSFENLNKTYTNISSDEPGPGVSNLEEIWEKSNCQNCISSDSPNLTNDTLYFLTMLNQTYNCFDQYQQGNHTELCKNCKKTYQELNVLYSDMEKNNTMCIDIEDAMNVTRRRWSKTFNCSFPREENVPIIAVSSFMLFLPIIFYLSSFLHSEQKKRKLIQPKRAPQYSSLMNIQDKLS